jgi:hypothetical protein
LTAADENDTASGRVSAVLSLLDVREPIFSRDTNWGDLVVTMVREGEAGRKVADLYRTHGIGT